MEFPFKVFFFFRYLESYMPNARLSECVKRGGYSSHIKCKGVQLTQINWQELTDFRKNLEEYPSGEPKYWMLSYIFCNVSVQ